MVDAVSRELILPALRLDVPPRPSKQQLTALAERSAEQWTTGPLAWATQQVVRLAVAAALQARLAPGPGRAGEHAVPTDPEQVTLARLATLFRPHVGLAAQAFELAVVEAVNAGVPAAVDPLRDGLRRVGVTGREPLRMVALGLDKLPARARPAFWEGVRGSTTVTAVVDAIAVRRGDSRPHDVSGLDRSQLARADALLIGGGRVTPLALSQRPAEAGSWLDVPLALTRRGRGDGGRRGTERDRGVEVVLQGEAWTDVFETALDGLGSAMHQIDTGGRPRGRSGEAAAALATRLVAARERTVADVCASLRAVDPFVLELFDHQVTTSAVPVAVPVVEDELFVQLWLPTSALAGPLFTGAPDLFLGGTADVRGSTQPSPSARQARPERQQGGRPPAREGSRGGGRRRKPRPTTPSVSQVTPTEAAPPEAPETA